MLCGFQGISSLAGCWLAAQKGDFFFCSPNLQGHALKGGQVLAFPSYYKSSQKLVGVNIGPACLIRTAFISMVITMWMLLPAVALG